MKTVRDNITDRYRYTETYLYLYGERYLCERKGYLSFRGVLVRPYDSMATKMRDILADWLKGGARYIVVADRQIDIEESACGLALTSLEKPHCSKGGRKKGNGK